MMALALKPRLLLLDESTAGMGDQETYHITELIRQLHNDHELLIVLIEHDMRVVFHLADGNRRLVGRRRARFCDLFERGQIGIAWCSS
jgi:ABC-type branched-subunit amino acid transport system ATPase component